MRDFSWKYFARTGDLDAYLLYKLTGETPLDVGGLLVEEEKDYDEEAQ